LDFFGNASPFCADFHISGPSWRLFAGGWGHGAETLVLALFFGWSLHTGARRPSNLQAIENKKRGIDLNWW
jgi:hypothetical protein